MKTLITFFKTIAMLIFIIGMLFPAVLTAQNPKPEFAPDVTGEYCIPFSDCSYGDGFESFAIMDIDNYFTGCSPDGYGDFTWMFTELHVGETYSLYAETGYDGNYFCVWIDFNDDFEFTPDELIVEDAYLEFGAQLYQVSVTIPEDALSGVHRMRAKTVWDYTATDPCADDFDGETEDYTVEIIGGGGFTDIGIISIDIPDVIAPGLIYPKVTLQNFGAETFTQQLSIINGADYGTSAFVFDMLPGEVRQITFAEWTAQIGTYTFHAYLSFEDDNSANDQYFKEVVVEIPDVEPPQNPSAEIEGNTVFLNWDAPSGKDVLGYRVYNNGVKVVDSLTQTAFTDLCLVSGNFSYTITALYDIGESPESVAVEVSLELCELLIFDEGFEAFSGEQQLVAQAQNMGIDYWHCWSQGPGNEEDPYISNEVVFEGQNSMVIQELNDVILELGGKTEGKWEVRFNIYVPAGFDGFFGIWREFSSYSSGLEVYFDANETGATKLANSNWEWFTYPIDTWNTIAASIDLDNDWGKIYINGQMIAQAQWSLDESGEPGPKKLDGIDFYAGTLWEGVPKSFVDNITLQKIIEDAMPPENLLAEVNQNMVSLNWDAPMDGDIVYSILRDNEEIVTSTALVYVDEMLQPGEYQYEIVADYGLCQSQPCLPVVAVLHPVQLINIPQGWSGLSSFLTPENPDIETIFQGCINQLIIVQNDNGVYWPGENLNTLINYNSANGYKIKMLESVDLAIRGPLVENKTLSLNQGWNTIPVLSECDVNVADLFADKDVILIKEIAGSKVYWPEYNIYSLEFLLSGKAYFVMMESGGSMEFPECVRTPSGLSPSPVLPLQGKGDDQVTPSNSSASWRRETGQRIGQCVGTPSPQGEGWGEVGGYPSHSQTLSELKVQKTPITHTIAIPANLEDENLAGKFLGAFGENNTCYGYTLLTGQNDALTLFGDDATTLEQDGFLGNEKLAFKMWDEQGDDKRNIEVVFDISLPQNSGTFVGDGISVIQNLKISTNNIENMGSSQITIFPNPAKDFINVQVDGIPDVGFELIITDLQGREIKSFQIGDGNLSLNISEMKRGIYVLKIFRFGKVYTEKLIIE